MAATVQVARVYDDPDVRQGARVLVDRVWPRGLAKADARLDAWLKAVAPSTGLRKWYGHDAAKFEEFARRYREELESGEQAEALAELHDRVRDGRVILLTATKDVEHSQAAVLADLLNRAR